MLQITTSNSRTNEITNQATLTARQMVSTNISKIIVSGDRKLDTNYLVTICLEYLYDKHNHDDKMTLVLTRSLRAPGGPCTESMEVSESRMERVKRLVL